MVLCRKNGIEAEGEVHEGEEQADSIEKRAEDSLHTLVLDAVAVCHHSELTSPCPCAITSPPRGEIVSAAGQEKMKGRGEARGERRMRQEARPTAVALCSPGVSVCQRVSEGERFGVTMFDPKLLTLQSRRSLSFCVMTSSAS